ncbi:hypothetical protein FRC16_003892 [Serendipita sp. 398]|nr:hypothetical protein FRC16_003892 [Serendipita sp. 398]
MDSASPPHGSGVSEVGSYEAEMTAGNRERVQKEPKVKKPRPKKPPIPTLPNQSEDSTGHKPRTGTFTLRRPKPQTSRNGTDDTSNEGKSSYSIKIETPGLICGASRGIVKHLSRDNVQRARGVEWIHVPLEEFLEYPLPVPALHPSPLPLHTFLTHPPERHILSLSLRDPGDNRNMPANTNAWVQANTVRGVRKVSVEDWIQWARAIRPDLVWAFLDTPKSLLGSRQGEVDEEMRELVRGEGRQTSQKRITKCLERSVAWTLRLMGGLVESSPDEPNTPIQRPPIIVPLLGGCNPRARAEFSRSLIEKLDNVDQQITKGLKKIDDAVTGYAFEMIDLPTNAYSTPVDLTFSPESSSEGEKEENSLTALVKASLRSLDKSKPRIAHSTPSPHVMLRLILECGIDLFDAPWVAEAADLGIALDFEFPARNEPMGRAASGVDSAKTDDPQRLVGHNLFDERFAQDFGPLGELGSCSSCWTCHPTRVSERILHSKVDEEQWQDSTDQRETSSTIRSFSRAYIHHLLHTHEMSAYALLHLHNLSVVDSFFANVRRLLISGDEKKFREEVVRFYRAYELPEGLFDEARVRWREVEDARGKGRLKREREALSSIGAEPSTQDVDTEAVESIEDGEVTPKAGAGPTAVILEGVEDLAI